MLFTKTIPLAAMCALASASITSVQVVHVFDSIKIGGTPVSDLVNLSSPNKASIKALFVRATPEECSSSISSLIATTPTPTPAAVSDFFVAAEATDICDLTAHSTMSSDIFKYLTSVLDWVFEEALVAYTLSSKCPAQWPEPTFNVVECVGGATIHFTGSANATSTLAVTDAFVDYVQPSSKPGAGFRSASVSIAAAVAACVLGFASVL